MVKVCLELWVEGYYYPSPIRVKEESLVFRLYPRYHLRCIVRARECWLYLRLIGTYFVWYICAWVALLLKVRSRNTSPLQNA